MARSAVHWTLLIVTAPGGCVRTFPPQDTPHLPGLFPFCPVLYYTRPCTCPARSLLCTRAPTTVLSQRSSLSHMR